VGLLVPPYAAVCGLKGDGQENGAGCRNEKSIALKSSPLVPVFSLHSSCSYLSLHHKPLYAVMSL